MHNLNREGVMWTAVGGVAITAALAYALERPEYLSTVVLFQFAETVVTIDTLAVAIFARWAWRWPIFAGWLVRVPVLEKTWRGTITPICADGDGSAAAPIAAMLEIHQTLFELSCLVRTGETKSRSFTAAVFIDPETQEQRLSYSYAADPSLRTRDRNPRHDGTAVMTLTTKPVLSLNGVYWTDRLTRGELYFEVAAQDQLF